jgi:hypothetical protein
MSLPYWHVYIVHVEIKSAQHENDVTLSVLQFITSD